MDFYLLALVKHFVVDLLKCQEITCVLNWHYMKNCLNVTSQYMKIYMFKQNRCRFFSPGDLLGHAVEVPIHLQGIRVLVVVTAILAPVVAPPASRQALSPLNPVLLLSSVSRKRLKLLKLLPRPRTLAAHLLRPRVPHQLTSPAQSPIV